MQHQATLGSHFAPYQIEPKRWWRSRLDESLGLEPMSDAQRAARRQWLADQRLAPEEPRYVPALYRRPFLLRLFSTPWDAIFWPLRPIFVSRIHCLIHIKRSVSCCTLRSLSLQHLIVISLITVNHSTRSQLYRYILTLLVSYVII